jgi:hypothetical protein
VNAAQTVIVVVGDLLLSLTVVIGTMVWANKSKRRHMECRREEWVAQGSIPEEEPNFYSGRDSGSGS